MKSLVMITAAVASLAATQVQAEPLGDPMRRVHYADLDLDTKAGVKQLHNRVNAAVTEMCGEVDAAHLATKPSIEHCRSVANDSAQQQLAVLLKTSRWAQLTRK